MRQQINNDERGMAHVMVAVLVVVVLVAIGLVGWRVMAKKNDKTPADKTTTVAAASAAYTSCLAQFHDTTLCHFAEAESAKPIDKAAYQATLTTDQSGTASTLVFAQDGNGNTSLTTSGGSASEQLNTVTYAGVTYIKNGSVWIKYPTTSTPAQTTDPSSDLTFMSSLTSEHFTKVDSEACGSLTCLKYKLTDTATPTATDYVWFDTHDYLLREFSSTDPSSGTTDMKLSYQAVSISVPSPVQDLSTTP